MRKYLLVSYVYLRKEPELTKLKTTRIMDIESKRKDLTVNRLSKREDQNLRSTTVIVYQRYFHTFVRIPGIVIVVIGDFSMPRRSLLPPFLPLGNMRRGWRCTRGTCNTIGSLKESQEEGILVPRKPTGESKQSDVFGHEVVDYQSRTKRNEKEENRKRDRK